MKPVIFSFFARNYNAHIVRLSYGNSLLNTPLVDDLGDFGGKIPGNTEGIQIVDAGGRWIAIVDGGDPLSGNVSSIAKLDFGGSLASTPVVTNWGNIGGLNYPHELFVFQDNNIWYGYTVNSSSNTITRFVFGADFTNPPIGTNLGNIGGLNLPLGMDAIYYGGNWYLYITNSTDGSITRLNFGNSLANTPTGVNLGNPQGNLANPRDISFVVLCDDIKALVVNWDNNSVSQLDFGTDPTSVPAAASLGNLGGLAYPHSISKLFRVNNDIFSLITNVQNNTLTRLRFEGCSLPASTLKNPEPITYAEPGTYSINLITDLGLPTQSSYCKQIMVEACCSPIQASLSANSICLNDTGKIAVTIISSPLNPPYTIVYSDDNNQSRTESNFQSGVPFPVSHFQGQTSHYSLVSITDKSNCQSTFTGVTASITVKPPPLIAATRSNDIDCAHPTSQLNATGGVEYSWSPTELLSNPGIADPVAGIAQATTFVVTGTAANGCRGSDSVMVKVTKSGANPYSVPNAFTPNNDNVNDCFGIRKWGSILLSEFSIYNRWGELVFHTTNPLDCWDGTFEGKLQPNGGYVYVIRGSALCGIIRRKGVVMLVR